MWWLTRRTLRGHARGHVATFVVVAVGTWIVSACGGLMETGLRASDGGNLVPLAGVSGGLAVMVAALAVISTVALAAQLRERELALLRAVAATPGQVRVMIVGEAMTVAAAAALVGCWGGPPAGRHLLPVLIAHDVAPATVAYRQGWIPLVAAIGIGLAFTLVAALAAAAGPARTEPVRALTQVVLQRARPGLLRTLLGVACLAGGAVLCAVTGSVLAADEASATAGPAVLVLAIAVALLGPAVTRPVLAVLCLPIRITRPATGELAVANLRARPATTAAIATPVTLACSIALANLYMQTTLANAHLAGSNPRGTQTQAWVNYLLIAVLVAYALVTMTNTLAATVRQRRGEFAALRLAGAGRSQILSMLTIESTLVGATGLLVGILLAAATAIPYAINLTGSPWPSGSGWILATVAALAPTLTAALTLLPALTLLSPRTIQTITDDA